MKIKDLLSRDYWKMNTLPVKVSPFVLALTLHGDVPSTQEEYPHIPNLQTEITPIYKRAVKTYKLDSQLISEPLPQEMIARLALNPQATMPCDTNYNHMPADQENFWGVIRHGLQTTINVQNSSKLSDKEKKEYQITAYKMLSQISRYKGTHDYVDLEAYNNLKSFLYFEKVIKFQDDYSLVLSREIGLLDERDEPLGRNWRDLDKLYDKAARHPGIEKFAEALYNNDERFFISYEDSTQLNKISLVYLNKWLKEQNISDKMWYYTDAEEDFYANAMTCNRNRGQILDVSVAIDPSGNLSDGCYSPVGSIIIHELQHLMQNKPSSNELPSDNVLSDNNDDLFWREGKGSPLIDELGPTLYSLALEDEIYKRYYHLPQDEPLNYGELSLGKNKVKLGELAIYFRKMMKKYPHKSVDKIILEDEVFNQLNRWGNGKIEQNIPTKARRNGR